VLVALLLALAVGMALTLPAGAAPRDPWYQDVPERFWAYREIRVMWEEECADGWVFTRWRWTPWGDWEETVSRFYPNDRMSRAQYAFLMAKTFRLQPSDDPCPTFSDVTRGFCLYGDKPAYGHIQAVAARGWILGVGESRFLPHDFVERQHAVAILIRALNLGEFARAMAPEVDRYLDRFPDGYQVDESVAAEVALAIRLGIIIGYDDGRLHPRDHLLRCQAIAIMVRSALIDVTAHPARLTPDGDGVEDYATFTFRTLKNRSTRKWSLSIGNLEGNPYRTFYPTGRPGEPPAFLEWDGRGDHGTLLPDGTYFYRAWITDSRGDRWFSALKPLTLEQCRLWGQLSPYLVQPGETVSLRASTTGGALRVSARHGSTVVDLSPARPPGPTGTNTWGTTLTVPQDAPEGPHRVTLVASFPGTTRRLDLDYWVRDPLTLTGTLDPNPARAGTRVRILAFTSTNASRVQADLPWGDRIVLQQRGPGQWQGSFRTQPETADGSYPVVLEARAGTRVRQHTLQLLIRGSALDDLTVILSD
jgi:hypothetical protein